MHVCAYVCVSGCVCVCVNDKCVFVCFYNIKDRRISIKNLHSMGS